MRYLVLCICVSAQFTCCTSNANLRSLWSFSGSNFAIEELQLWLTWLNVEVRDGNLAVVLTLSGKALTGVHVTLGEVTLILGWQHFNEGALSLTEF